MLSKFNSHAIASLCERTLRGATTTPKRPSYAYRGQDEQPPSLQTMECNTAPPRSGQYSGTAMIGISTLHKSNSVPVFSQADAVDIAHMRR